MPKTNPLTQAQKERQREDEVSKNCLHKINVIKAGMDVQTDEDFALLLGVSYARFRTIKRDPLSMRMREMRKLLDMSEACGIPLHMSSDGLINARA